VKVCIVYWLSRVYYFFAIVIVIHYVIWCSLLSADILKKIKIYLPNENFAYETDNSAQK